MKAAIFSPELKTIRRSECIREDPGSNYCKLKNQPGVPNTIKPQARTKQYRFKQLSFKQTCYLW